MARDYYEILGVGKSASKDEIKRAYRKLAHEYHPDKGQSGDEAKFREINEAYEVLSDDTQRTQYNQFGQTFEQVRAQGQGGFGGFSGFSNFSDFMRGFGENYSKGPYSGMDFDFGDIFSDMFGSPRRGRTQKGIDLEMVMQIEFLDSVFGTEKDVTLEKKDNCPVCLGSGGEKGSKIENCARCHGTGQIMEHRKTILGSFQQVRTCEVCYGIGKVPEKKCSECFGAGIKKQNKQVKVIIPPGIDNGQRLKLTGEGEVGYKGSKPGDLYIQIQIKPHTEFARHSFDILSEVPVSFYQAALGASVEVNTVDGRVELKISSGTQSGKVLRLRGKGVPHLESLARGDHLATIRVITPTKLTKKEKDLFKQIAEERGESVDVDQSLWRKIKDSF